MESGEFQEEPPHSSSMRAPPQALDAERSVLGGVILDPESLADVQTVIGPEDFYRDAHRKVFETMCGLAAKNEPIDRVTIKAHLVAAGALEVSGGEEFIDLLDKLVPTSSNLANYARIVAEKAMLRRAIEAATAIAMAGYEQHGDAASFLDDAERRIFAVRQDKQASEMVLVKSRLPQVFKEIEARFERSTELTGMPSGLEQLDALTCGFHPGELIVIAARPSMGKSSLARRVAREVCCAPRAVGLFSMEVPIDSVVLQLLASEARVNSQLLRSGKLTDSDFNKLAHGAQNISDMPLFVNDEPAISSMKIRAHSRRLAAKQANTTAPLGAIIVDYLQLMGGHDGKEREERVSANSADMKALAMQLGIPVFLLAQLNREVEKRPNKRPQLSDLRESGAIEQNGDVILFIYRGEVYGDKETPAGEADIIVGKQRNGPIGEARVAFIKEYSTFQNLPKAPAKPTQMRLAREEPPPPDSEYP